MNQTTTWYQTLIKPTWAPPSYLFGPVWTVLYVIIAFSFSFVFYKFFTKSIPFLVVLPFILNLVFNLAFSPIQFGLQNSLLASIDILLVLGTLIWAMIVIHPHHPVVTYVNIPYLLWVGFATTIQLTITYLNW